MPNLTLNGDIWTTDAVTALQVDAKDAKDLLLPIVQALLPEGSPFLKSLWDKMGKRLPLSGRFSLQQPALPRQQPQQPNGGTQSLPSLPMETITVAFTTESVQNGLMYDASLFTIPEDYTRIEPPQDVSAFTLPHNNFPGGNRP
jgi:hypothetical protein